MKKKFILLPLVVLALGACANGGNKEPAGPTFPDDPTYTDPVAAPVDKIEVGKVYKAGFYQATIKKQLYALGQTAEEAKFGDKQVDYYLATTQDLKLATSWTFEQGSKADSYRVVLKRNGTPSYLNIEGTHLVLKEIQKEATTEWTWNAKAKTIVTGTSFCGTYSDHETVSTSKTDYITKSSNFPLQFYEVGEAVAPTAVKVTASPTTVFAGQKSFLRTSLEPKFGKGEIELTAAADDVAAEKLTIDPLGNLKVDKTVPADTKVTVTAKCGTLTATAEITVKAYVDFGEETPINVTKAKEALAAIGENAQTPCKMTVVGEVVSNDAYSTQYHNYGSIVIKTGTDELTLFRTGYGKPDDKHSLDTLYAAENSMKGTTLTVTGVGANGEYEGTKYSRVQYAVIDSIEGAPNPDAGQGGEGEGGEGQGGETITSKVTYPAVPAAHKVLTAYNFELSTETTGNDWKAILAASNDTKVEGSEDKVVTATYKNAYHGNDQYGPEVLQNAKDIIKLGKSKENGTLTLTLADGTKVTKVAVLAHDYYAKSAEHPTNTNGLKINNGEVQLAPYTEDCTFDWLTFDVTETNVLEFVSNTTLSGKGGRVFIRSIVLYTAA